jgi:hypothetical protein
MILYCHFCNETHQFSNGEVERIVYTLQGELGDYAIGGMPLVEQHEEAQRCLRSWLSASHDIEEYGEFAEAGVACRLRSTGVLRRDVTG